MSVRTIKLKLKVVGNTKEAKDASWKRIRQISNDTWRAANYIASGQYFNDMAMRHLYVRNKIDPKDMEAVGKAEESFRAVFGTKRQATTERDVKAKFPELPPAVTNPLNQLVVAGYRAEKPDMLMGNRSLRRYRRGIPIPTTTVSIEIALSDEGHRITWKPKRGERLYFEVYYGRDKAQNRLTVKRILEMEDYNYGAPSIQLNDKGLFLLLPVKEPEQQLVLDKDRIVGVDLGIVVPAYVALSDHPERRQPIGFKDDFIKTRLQMQSRHRRLQKGLLIAHGGNGRKRKMKAMDRLRDKERHFARTYNHLISRRAVDFAIKHEAGTIHMEMLAGFGEQKGHEFFLRNWSYFELQKLIEEKAKRTGIIIKYVDPYHTSQTCSLCGHWEPGQREKQDKFICKKCGTKMNADHNAAVNIARSTRIVIRKEQCQKYKENEAAKKNKTETAGHAAGG